MDRIVYGVEKSQTQLSDFHFNIPLEFMVSGLLILYYFWSTNILLVIYC